MAERILVTPEEMAGTIQKYTASKQELQNAYNEMRAAVAATEGSWQSDASTAFRSSFNAMYANIEQTEAKMDDAINELKAVDELFREGEARNATFAGGLEAGTGAFNA